jgi:hypothetical protein
MSAGRVITRLVRVTIPDRRPRGRLFRRKGGSGDKQLCTRYRAGWPVAEAEEEAGHEEPWFTFLTGDNPDYPEKILAAAQAQVRHRLARMRAHRDIDVTEADIHLWQQCNPVVTEALVQLTWGGPQVIYNWDCSRPGSATTMPAGAAPACPTR